MRVPYLLCRNGTIEDIYNQFQGDEAEIGDMQHRDAVER
jgi:hypothetical protein